MTIDIPEGYEALGLALGEAVAQAACGKGSERHAEKGEKFFDQPILEIPRRLGDGGVCAPLYQAVKKIYESRRLEPARARAELLGAVNYLAAAWCLLGGRESVFAPDAPKAPGNVCLGFAERVVSLMKEAGVREVSFAGPGARICADGTVTGLHFTTEDFQSGEGREAESVSAPERLFRPGEDVEILDGGEWRAASYVRPEDGGLHTVLLGSSRLSLPASGIRKASPGAEDADGSGLKDAEALCRRIREANPAVYPPEDVATPLFPERTPVECRPTLESEWTPAFYIGVDPSGFHVVERGGMRMHLSAEAVRAPEKS